MSKYKFGRILITQSALSALAPEDIQAGLDRHAAGDWGGVCEEDARLNDTALKDGTRLLSVYSDRTDTAFWIITEADRSVTTVLLPEDY